jgi:hypothetical protein
MSLLDLLQNASKKWYLIFSHWNTGARIGANMILSLQHEALGEDLQELSAVFIVFISIR